MLVLKKVWPFMVTGLVVICIGAFLFWQEDAPVAPLKTYKATPASQRDKVTTGARHDHSPEHMHESASHSPHVHTEETVSGEDTDWRDDSAWDSSLFKQDPWKQTYSQGASGESADGEGDETYPPHDWYKTEDPELRAEYFRAQLIKQFGDIPEVHTVADLELRNALGIPTTVDDFIDFVEAQYALWPHEKTLRTLKRLRKAKAEGTLIIEQ